MVSIEWVRRTSASCSSVSGMSGSGVLYYSPFVRHYKPAREPRASPYLPIVIQINHRTHAKHGEGARLEGSTDSHRDRRLIPVHYY
jgi:hypothetical protein